MGVALKTVSDLSTFVPTRTCATSVVLGRGSLVGTRKAATSKSGRLFSLLNSTWAFSISFESLEMIVVGEWETNGNDSIAGTYLCTFGVFLGSMLLHDLEDKFIIGVQL
jgi:hypothetical protein